MTNRDAVRREIEVGARGNGLVEIVSGLEPSDAVVPVTQTNVAVGSRVRPVEPD